MIAKSLDKVVAFAGGCVALATGGLTVAGVSGVGASAAAVYSTWREGKAKHGPESGRIVAGVRAAVLAEFGAEEGHDDERRALLEGADFELGELILECMPPPERLVACFGQEERFARTAALLTLDELASRHDLFAASGPGAEPLARRFALTVLEAALAAALTDKEYFSRLLPHLLDAIKRDTAEAHRQLKAVAEVQLESGAALLRIETGLNEIRATAPLSGAATARVALESLLEPAASYRDSWRSLSVQVNLVGRASELDALRQFAEEPVGFGWQVLQGGHASGKSRLGYEWLRMLETGGGWNAGYLSEEAVRKLASAEAVDVDRDTAILIDNTEALGDSIWEAMLRTIASEPGSRVRFLLIGHTDLKPPSHSFGHQQVLAAARSAFSLPDTAAGYSRMPPPLRLKPIAAVDDQRRIVELAAAEAGVEIGPSEIDHLVAEVGGQPAFLALAGARPHDWKHRLIDYAQSIVAEACRLFPAHSEDGLAILLLSALAGPADDKVCAAIAPNANDPRKLRLLFPEAEEDLSQVIPRFEPDLLGQEVIFETTRELTGRQRKDLAEKIAGLAPQSFIDRVLMLWRREEAIGWITANYFFPGRREEAHRGRVLEILRSAIPPKQDTSLLDRIAAEVFIRALARSLDAGGDGIRPDGWRSMILAAYTPANPTLFSRFIGEMLRDTPLAIEDVGPCVTILRYMSANDQIELPPSLAPLVITSPRRRTGKDARDESAEIRSRLASRRPIERLHAACQVYADGLAAKVRPAGVLPQWAEISSHLDKLLRSVRPIDRMAAVIAYNGVLNDEQGGWGYQRIPAEDWSRLEASLAAPEDHPALLELKVDLISLAYRHPFSIHWLNQWLPAAKGSYVVPLRAELPRGSEIIVARLLELAGTANSLPRQDLATALFNADSWDNRIAAEVVAAVDKAKLAKILRVVLRLLHNPDEAARDLVVDLLASIAERWRPAVVSACAQYQATDVVEKIGASFLDLGMEIEISDLIDEMHAAARSRSWEGPVAAALRSRLADLVTGDRGHLVHKLKAKDTTGRWAYYFVLVEAENDEAFAESLKGSGIVDLEDYGIVIASSYGERPSEEVVRFLKERYGFDV